MKKRTVILIQYLILMLPFSAAAEPVYLECSAGTGKDRQDFTVALDESTRKVTHTQSKGHAFNADVFFTPDKISYQKIDLPARGLKMTRQWEISRTDLKVIYTFQVEPLEFRDNIPTEPPLISKGTCSIMEVKGRKF